MPRSRSACVVRGPSRGRGHVVCGDCNLLRLGRFATGDLLWIKRIDVRIGAGRDDRRSRAAVSNGGMRRLYGKPYGLFCTDTIRSYLIFAQKRVTSGVGALWDLQVVSTPVSEHRHCVPLCDTLRRAHIHMHSDSSCYAVYWLQTVHDAVWQVRSGLGLDPIESRHCLVIPHPFT